MKLHTLFTAIFFSLPLALPAQEKAMTLQQCLSQALTGSLAMRAGTVSAARARDLQGTVYDIDKTSVSLSQDLTSGGSPDNGITVSQTIDFPTVYAARRKYLKAETAIAESELGMTRATLTRDVTAAYHNLLLARRTMQILQEQDSIYRKFLTVATARRTAGESGNLEVMNASRLLSENRLALQKAESDYTAGARSLQRLINADAPVIPADTAMTAMAVPVAETATPFDATPLGTMHAAQLEASQRGLKLARQEYMPSVTLGVTTQMVIKGFNPYDVDRSRFEKGDFMGFEVGVGVPLFYGAKKARVKAARRNVELAEISREQARRQQDTDYRNAVSELKRAAEAMRYYSQEAVTQAESMRKLSQLAYENGEIGYVEYVQNQQTALSVQLQYANAVNDYNQAVTNLNWLLGL